MNPKIKKINQEQIDTIIAMDNMYENVTLLDYFLAFQKSLFNVIEYSDVDPDIENLFIKKDFELLGYVERSETEGRTVCLCKDNFYARVVKTREDMKCNLTLGFSTDTKKSEIEKLNKEICSFQSKKTKNPTIGILHKDQCSLGSDLIIKQFEISVPTNVDLKVNYGSNFFEEHKKIKQKLSEEQSGLFIFHGTSGCGKSTYIKKLAEEIKDKKFVYVPEFMVSSLNEPTLMGLFIEHKNSVMVIEDAEKVILEREKNNSSLVSILLNISDGILSDVLKTPIILTYNTKTENIDEALLRKGRLKYMHEFKTLEVEEVKKILSRNKMLKKDIDDLVESGKIKNHMTIADVFNLQDDVGKLKEKEEVKKIPLGFSG